MDPSRKRNLNGGGDWGSHGGHWDRSGGNGPRNSEGQNHSNGAGFGSRLGGHAGGGDVNNSGSGGARGGNGNNTNPPSPTPIRAGNSGRRSELSEMRLVGVEGTIDWGGG